MGSSLVISRETPIPPAPGCEAAQPHIIATLIAAIVFLRYTPASGMEEDIGGGTDDQLVPTEVKFVDFQSARFASLATDLNLFLFTSVQVRTFCLNGVDI